MAPIRRRKKDAADQTMTCLDALRLLDISRDAPTLKGTGPAGEATTPPPPPPPPLPQEVDVEPEPEASKLPSPPAPQEVEVEPETPKHSSLSPTSQEVEMEPETSKLPSPTPPQEVKVEAELETPKHPSPPPPSQEVEMEAEPETSSKHSSPPPPPPQEAEAEAESDMAKHIKTVLKAMLDMAALPDYDEGYGNYLGDFFKDLIQTPRPIDPLWLPALDSIKLMSPLNVVG